MGGANTHGDRLMRRAKNLLRKKPGQGDKKSQEKKWSGGQKNSLEIKKNLVRGTVNRG